MLKFFTGIASAVLMCSQLTFVFVEAKEEDGRRGSGGKGSDHKSERSVQRATPPTNQASPRANQGSSPRTLQRSAPRGASEKSTPRSISRSAPRSTQASPVKVLDSRSKNQLRQSGRNIQRSPSLSRSTPRTGRRSINVTPATPQVRSQRNIPAVTPSSTNYSQRDGRSFRRGGQTGTRDSVRQFVKNNPRHRVEQNKTDEQRRWSNHPRGESKNFSQIGKNVRENTYKYRPNRHNWFNRSFWDRHHYHPPYYGRQRNWWGVASTVGLGAWLGWQISPYYYGYYGDYWGPSEYYENTYIERDYQQIYQPSYQEQNQTIEIASTDTSNDEWMPLGVFAVSKNDETTGPPNMFVQLALNKEGVIAGTFYNATTDQTYELEGIVEQEDQRAVWKIADDPDSPIVETGIYNLTQSELPIRVYFSDGRTQDMILVRIPEN